MALNQFAFLKRTLILSLTTFTLSMGIAGLVGCPTSPGTATPEPEEDGPVCGNGEIDLGEVCDGNNLDGESCSSLGLNEGDLSCRDDCSGFIRSGCGEAASCGDGVRETSETCDTNDLNGATCDSLGFQGGLVTCAATCLYDTSACGAPLSCGDGIVQDGEACDSAALGGTTCEALGFGAGTLSCNSQCQGFVIDECGPGPSCGNGVLDDNNEVCDIESFGGATCESAGFGPGFLVCRANCTGFSTDNCAPPPSVCGDGVIEQNEVCEPGMLEGKTCTDFDLAGDGLACNPDTCQYEIAECCVPDCSEAECGADPVCGTQCPDTCGADETCNDDNICIDPCSGQTCSGQGACSVADGAAICSCNAGFLPGADLSCVENPCDGQTCSGNGTCEIVDVAAMCICEAGYLEGDNLTCEADPCFQETCSGNGICEAANGAPLCVCNDGYENGSATSCVEVTTACTGETCSGNGTCVLNGTTASCMCNTGYVTGPGLSCEAEAVDLCSGVTCNGVGDCYIDAQAGAFCICDTGYIRDALDITQCVVDANPPPASWTCGGETYGDGFCDCGCGVIDEDCSGPLIEVCEYQGCPSPLYPNDTQNWICE